MNDIEKAKALLKEICQTYKHHDKEIKLGIEGEKQHALDALECVEKLNPNASIPLKLAALFHDIDRVATPEAGGGFKGDRSSKAYLEHKKMHAKRSAEFIIPVLQKHNVASDILKRTEFLIIHHDDPGEEVEKINDMDLNYLVTADTLAFFMLIAQKIYETEGLERLKDKIRFMVDKLPDFAKKQLLEHRLKEDIFNNLKNEIIKEHYMKRAAHI